MRSISGIENFKSKRPTSVTIGTFDGVHLGHQKILKKLVEAAQTKHYETVLITFFPHPRTVVQSDDEIKLLTTLDERKSLLEKTGLDTLIVQEFTPEFSRLTPLEFVRNILVAQLNVKEMTIGFNHRFGKNRSAGIDDLRHFGEVYDFTVNEIEAKTSQQVSISSTKIRNALHLGKVELANTFLGFSYQLAGTVVRGKALGRQLGFPTANLNIEESYKLIPKEGVYFVKSELHHKTIYGMLNIGRNPTVDAQTLSIEVHFLDWSGDLYGQKIKLELLQFLRDEKKFDSLNALKSQLEKDRNQCLDLLK